MPITAGLAELPGHAGFYQLAVEIVGFLPKGWQA